jgi:Lon protease-like protein
MSPKMPPAPPTRGETEPAWGGPAPTEAGPVELPLFPLKSVLFPDGLLGLRVFEARYLDLVSTCLRERSTFGVVALRRGGEARAQRAEEVRFESVGTLVELLDVDSPQPGILELRCRGSHRFTLHARRQQADGLWVANTDPVPDDEDTVPTAGLIESVRGLEQAIASLKEQGTQPFLEPFRFDCAGWVANRWCEILPLSLPAKQKLMALPDGLVRLQLVDEFLRGKGVVR